MERFLLICLGGAIGTGARYALSTWLLHTYGPAFPYGTLAVNVLGSFFLGAIMVLGLSTGHLSPTMRLTLGTGVMGGFTTYSTFNHETLHFIEQRAYRTAGLYVAVTLAACLLAGALGAAAARKLTAG
jgi:CrcB protein